MWDDLSVGFWFWMAFSGLSEGSTGHVHLKQHHCLANRSHMTSGVWK